MRLQIKTIDTSIRNRELFISFFGEHNWFPIMEASFDSIIQEIGKISIFEIDLLNGCYLKTTSFYARGEETLDGTIVFEENKFPKTWKIEFDGTLEDLRVRNSSQLLSFKRIYDITISHRNSIKPYIRITTLDGKSYPYDISVLESVVGLKETEFPILKGVFIAPRMFKKGETSEFKGRFTTIKQDDKIVASLNIRIEGTLDNHFKLYNQLLHRSLRNNAGESSDSSFGNNYQKYNGYNDWDDDSIDSAFDGNPDATWNVD